MRPRLLIIAVLVAGTFVGIAADRSFFPKTATVVSADESCGDAYRLINTWLRCEPEENLKKKREFTDFRVGLERKIAAWKTDGKITDASIYLRDLQFGPWTGINEQAEFSAASLLKVPVMLAVLKQSETHPEILGQEIQITQELMDYQQEFQPRRRIESDKIYTVDELLEYMIIYSDNNAKNALDAYLDVLKPDDLLLFNTMEELGFAGVYRTLEDALTVKQVASLFRILYNASYLRKDMSQKALDLLLRSDFREGIVGGLPSGIPVAHKFGEREFDDDNRQLHDCGIVYYPANHYLLCIMTSGQNEKDLVAVIEDISRTIYEEMVLRNQGE